ncbi:hypothetical protein BD626DRAFT_575781 [Schizophyllum amplum]|uniref:Uncharacterized protein n=1 Tax=Schizophyllum amplum TaxID=97359 RepID=A0A550BV06_9AGAR|nr:hypothetical protein BD626DRAFT_575781 [Auriculariopsis ampla]
MAGEARKALPALDISMLLVGQDMRYGAPSAPARVRLRERNKGSTTDSAKALSASSLVRAIGDAGGLHSPTSPSSPPSPSLPPSPSPSPSPSSSPSSRALTAPSPSLPPSPRRPDRPHSRNVHAAL